MKKINLMILSVFVMMFIASCDGKEDVKPVDEFAEIKAKLTGRWVMEYVQTNDGKTWSREQMCDGGNTPEQYIPWINEFSFEFVNNEYFSQPCELGSKQRDISYIDNDIYTIKYGVNVFYTLTIISNDDNQIQLELTKSDHGINPYKTKFYLNKVD